MPGIAALMFTKYVCVFEVTAALLITAAVGAMILAHIEKRARRRRSASPSGCQGRFLPGNYRAPKPGPGVFATSDSVATPARLPDGAPGANAAFTRSCPTRELTAGETGAEGG